MRRVRHIVLGSLLVLVAAYALTLGLHARHANVPPLLVVDGAILDTTALCAAHDGGETTAQGDCPLCRLPVADLWLPAPSIPVATVAGHAVVFAAPVMWSAKRRGWSPGNARAPPLV